MKIYIASSDQHAGKALRDTLASAGHSVTSRWLDDPDYVSLPADAVKNRASAVSNIDDIRPVALLILRAEPDGTFARGGKHVETGVALALQKPILVLGYPENVFHWHPSVTIVHDTSELSEQVRRLEVGMSGSLGPQLRETEVDNLTKMQFDYAWKWFDLHSKQRTSVFNYYMLIIGIFASAFVTAYKEDYTHIVHVIGVLGALTSVAFIFFDWRNRDLVTYAEDILEKLERDHIYPEGFKGDRGNQLGFLLVERRTGMREGARRGFLANLKKHKLWIRGLEGVIACCFLASLFLPRHDPTPSGSRLPH